MVTLSSLDLGAVDTVRSVWQRVPALGQMMLTVSEGGVGAHILKTK